MLSQHTPAIYVISEGTSSAIATLNQEIVQMKAVAEDSKSNLQKIEELATDINKTLHQIDNTLKHLGFMNTKIDNLCILNIQTVVCENSHGSGPDIKYADRAESGSGDSPPKNSDSAPDAPTAKAAATEGNNVASQKSSTTTSNGDKESMGDTTGNSPNESGKSTTA